MKARTYVIILTLSTIAATFSFAYFILVQLSLIELDTGIPADWWFPFWLACGMAASLLGFIGIPVSVGFACAKHDPSMNREEVGQQIALFAPFATLFLVTKMISIYINTGFSNWHFALAGLTLLVLSTMVVGYPEEG